VMGYNDAIKDYDYNVEKAKKLLAEAGYPNGFETDLWTLPIARPYILNGKKMGEMMQADLQKVGIKAKLVTYDWPTYLAKSKIGAHQMLQMGWTGDNGDPDNFLFVLLSCSAVEGGSNRSRWCDKKYDDLVQKAKLTSKPLERAALYKQAQVVAKEQAPQVALAHAKTFRAMRKNVTGYKLDPLGSDYFYPVNYTGDIK
jgi:dipeptide transport system substrate-binding protein